MSDDMFYCSFVSIHYIICECGETFPSEEELKNHLEKTHAPKNERTEYKCGICDAIYDTEHECIEHYEQSHIQLEESEYSAEDVQDDEDVKDDKIILQYLSEEGEYTAEVVQDDQDIKDDESIEKSVIVQSKPEVKQRKKKPKSKLKNIVCEICGKRYASNAALKYHQRVHTGERPYQCPLCDKSFTMPLFLQIHIRTHTGEKPYQCPHCPKAFSNRAALLRHSRVHTGIKPYGCPKCGKFFTQSNSMKLHVNTVHLKMPAPYKSKSRRLKALEREMMRKSAVNNSDKNEDTSAVESIKQESNLDHCISSLDLVATEHEDLNEAEIIHEEVDSKEITYEVIYE